VKELIYFLRQALQRHQDLSDSDRDHSFTLDDLVANGIATHGSCLALRLWSTAADANISGVLATICALSARNLWLFEPTWHLDRPVGHTCVDLFFPLWGSFSHKSFYLEYLTACYRLQCLRNEFFLFFLIFRKRLLRAKNKKIFNYFWSSALWADFCVLG